MSAKDSTFSSFARSVSLPSLAPLTNEQDGRPLTCDLKGALYINPGTTPPVPPAYTNGKRFVRSLSISASQQVSTGSLAFDLLEFYGFKSGTTALRYLQIFNTFGLPSNGTIPIISIPLAGSNTIFSMSNPVLYDILNPMFANSAYAALSTTPDTLTFSAVGGFWFNAMAGLY
jgi:hypothetical protein